ncbi:OmpA family protein [Chitinophaga pendula]|uniref:OmpA family protein n=1 Tax=Chitinophaga TaxID=79328 RepID=UPI000BAEC964|nr:MULTISPECIES: OmpA family protein [Chitinophaga]ASZ11694.1 hypothetical protein CK934_12350 [Chitinophaga sp. MD30]UCJ05290.1 OmpA family protein [Chitinophaga pendula]
MIRTRRRQLFEVLLFLPGLMILFASCKITNSALGDRGKVQRAERLYKRQEYEKAISLCSAVLNNGNRDEALLRGAKLQLARIYFETRQFEKTISLYDELLQTPQKDVWVTDVINYIDLLKRTGRISKARKTTELYAKSFNENARFTNLQRSLDNFYSFFNPDSLRHMKVDSLRLSLPGYQYGLALYRNDIVFISNEVKKDKAQSFYTNSRLYMITEDGIAPFNHTLRGVLQVGPAAFYEDGHKVIFTSNRYNDVKTEKQSFISNKNTTQLLSASYQPQQDTWSKPAPLRLYGRSDNYSFLHPSIANKGKRLYFASDMPGGYGGTDIYYTDWDKKEKRWKAPVNLGPGINTNGNELYPFFFEEKLLFASNGLPGFGGLDIFIAKLNEKDTAPVHLPYPVNTQFDDLNPVLDQAHSLLYFTSDRSGIHDNDHIYVLNLKKHMLPQLDLPVPGRPVKQEEKVPYTVTPSNRAVITYVGNKEGDTPLSEPVKQAIVHNEQERALTETGSAFVAKKKDPGVIYFDLDSYVPQDQEWYKLDTLFLDWKRHPERTFLVAGHADVTGPESHNLNLSKNRAMYIKESLRSRGVDPARIKVSYFGSTKPLLAVEQDTISQDKALFLQAQGINRRCEVSISAN